MTASVCLWQCGRFIIVMKPYSTLERNPATNRSSIAVDESQLEELSAAAKVPGNGIGKTSGLRFPGEMAEADLDAALQLLADRAQYITGAGGAAVALRDERHNDLICRASAGANAPDVGALLSAEFGLSGESVRTRQPLRCDDAERDPRVNREGCRQMGISSVVVMPIVHDDEVVGVFELFSGKANAFGDRDLTALKRLSELVETAVRLAYSADNGMSAAVEKAARNDKDRKPPQPAPGVMQPGAAMAEVSLPKASGTTRLPGAGVLPASVVPAISVPERAKPSVPKKPLFWSAALVPSVERDQQAEADRSHVPAVLRNRRKCQACGFPVSEGRMLCVECEEKKWRGKLAIAAPKQSGESAMERAVAAIPAAEQASPAALSVHPEKRSVDAARLLQGPGPDLVLSAGLPRSESWFSANKYVLIFVAIVGGLAAAVAFLH